MQTGRILLKIDNKLQEVVPKTGSYMDDLFGQIECRSKSDSIVMRILRSAMDKVHEKLQSKDGPIEFLHGRSTFYELAAILVEGGLNIIQEETEILEGSDKIITDLMEIRDWLHGRIHDMKELIVEKDRELTERLHNETKLQQALELKDRELVNLSEKIEPGMMKNEEMVNSPTSNQAIEKLKNSVDLQVSNIKQKLEEDEKKSLIATERRTRKTRLSSPNLSFDFLENEEIQSSSPQWFSGIKSQKESSRPDQNESIRRMSSDIDILKETIDLAFGRMQKALPSEKQWRWNIEKDIESILVKGFISNLQQSFDVELKKKVALLKDNWFYFIDEMRFLCRELKGFFARNDDESSNPFLAVQRTTSLPDISCIENDPVEEDSEGDDGTHRVAKMIKNHESIIRKQNEEWNWLTREVIQRSERYHKDDSNRLERRIQDAITRLDNLIERNHKLVDQKGDSDRNRIWTKRRNIPKHDKRTKTSKVESFEQEEIEKLKEERNGLCFQISVMEDTYKLLFRGLVKDITTALCCKDTQKKKKNDSCEFNGLISRQILLRNYLESAIREDLYVVVFQETVKQWKKKFVDECFIASRANKVSDNILSDNLLQLVEEKAREIDSVLQEHIRSLLKEEIYVVFFREIAEAWRSEKEDYAIDSSIKEDIYQLVIKEALKNVHMNLTESLKQLVFQEHSTPRSRILDVDNGEEGTPRSTKLENNGDESSLIQKVDSLLKCVEAEEDLMLSASSEIKKHSVSNSLVILNCEEVDERKAIEWLITDDESTFSSVSRKLERALQQLYTSKELLVDMEQTLEVSSDELGVNNEVSIIDHDKAGQRFLHEKADDQGDKVLKNIIQFQRVLANIERVLHENLESKCLRLEILKREVKTLTEPVALMRRRKFQYKRAFISRCQNLRLAETEVDLLGDQVEALMCLLQRIYGELNKNAPGLSAYFEVYDILKLINRELR